MSGGSAQTQPVEYANLVGLGNDKRAQPHQASRFTRSTLPIDESSALVGEALDQHKTAHQHGKQRQRGQLQVGLQESLDAGAE